MLHSPLLSIRHRDDRIERYEAIRALAVEMVSEHGDIDSSRVHNLFASDTGYATPKIDVRAAVFRDDGALLLARERSDGGWTLPGGWVDIDDSPSGAVEKEVREEAGLLSPGAPSPRTAWRRTL